MLAEVPSPRGFGVRGNGGIHCPRAFRRVVSNPPYLVGYCRWDGRSGRMTPPDNHTHDFTSHPFIEVVGRHQAAPALKRLAKSGPLVDAFGLGVDVREADFCGFGPERHEAPTHDVEGALPGPGVVTRHRQAVGWRDVPAGGEI